MPHIPQEKTRFIRDKNGHLRDSITLKIIPEVDEENQWETMVIDPHTGEHRWEKANAWANSQS